MLTIKGIIIGIGKIIPGVSGSMLAIALGIYEKLIGTINNFFKDPIRNFTFLFKISLGVLISIIVFSRLILKFLNANYIATVFLFIGLIIGSYDSVIRNIKIENKSIIVLAFTIITLLGLLNIKNDIYIENDFMNFLFYIFIGFVDALTTIIPGISGTAVLMMLGAYTTLIESFCNPINSLNILIPFLIGFVFGILIMSKIIEYLFNKYKSNMYNLILGFSLATIALMFLNCFNSLYDLSDLILAIILLLTGMFISKKINQLFLID